MLLFALGCFRLEGVALQDRDRDGIPAQVDCDDEDAALAAKNEEVCNNGFDDDCDGDAEGCRLVAGQAATTRFEVATRYGAPLSVAVVDLDEDARDELLVLTEGLDGGDPRLLHLAIGDQVTVTMDLAVPTSTFPVTDAVGAPWIAAALPHDLLVGVVGAQALYRFTGPLSDTEPFADQVAETYDAPYSTESFGGPATVAVDVPLFGEEDVAHLVATMLTNRYTYAWPASGEPDWVGLVVNNFDTFSVQALAAGDVDGDGSPDLIGQVDLTGEEVYDTALATLSTPVQGHEAECVGVAPPCWEQFSDYYKLPLLSPAPVLAFFDPVGWSAGVDLGPFVVVSAGATTLLVDVGDDPTVDHTTTLFSDDDRRIWASWDGAEACDGRPSAAGDLDGDGITDLVLACGTSLLVHYGEGVFSGMDVAVDGVWLGGGTVAAAVGDVDGDGRDDIVTASTDEVLIYRGVAW